MILMFDINKHESKTHFTIMKFKCLFGSYTLERCGKKLELKWLKNKQTNREYPANLMKTGRAKMFFTVCARWRAQKISLLLLVYFIWNIAMFARARWMSHRQNRKKLNETRVAFSLSLRPFSFFFQFIFIKLLLLLLFSNSLIFIWVCLWDESVSSNTFVFDTGAEKILISNWGFSRFCFSSLKLCAIELVVDDYDDGDDGVRADFFHILCTIGNTSNEMSFILLCCLCVCVREFFLSLSIFRLLFNFISSVWTFLSIFLMMFPITQSIALFFFLSLSLCVHVYASSAFTFQRIAD